MFSYLSTFCFFDCFIFDLFFMQHEQGLEGVFFYKLGCLFLASVYTYIHAHTFEVYNTTSFLCSNLSMESKTQNDLNFQLYNYGFIVYISMILKL